MTKSKNFVIFKETQAATPEAQEGAPGVGLPRGDNFVQNYLGGKLELEIRLGMMFNSSFSNEQGKALFKGEGVNVHYLEVCSLLPTCPQVILQGGLISDEKCVRER